MENEWTERNMNYNKPQPCRYLAFFPNKSTGTSSWSYVSGLIKITKRKYFLRESNSRKWKEEDAGGKF